MTSKDSDFFVGAGYTIEDVRKAYVQGKAEAYEDAAKIAEACTEQHGGAGRIHLDLANAIRARAKGVAGRPK